MFTTLWGQDVSAAIPQKVRNRETRRNFALSVMLDVLAQAHDRTTFCERVAIVDLPVNAGRARLSQRERKYRARLLRLAFRRQGREAMVHARMVRGLRRFTVVAELAIRDNAKHREFMQWLDANRTDADLVTPAEFFRQHPDARQLVVTLVDDTGRPTGEIRTIDRTN